MMISISRFFLGFAAILSPLAAVRAQVEPSKPTVFHREHVLGTSLYLAVSAERAAAEKVEAAIVAEISRLEKVLSTYDKESEISALKRPGAAQAGSFDLRAVLRSCEFWMERSGGVFHPGVTVYSDLWRRAAETGTPPTDAELSRAKDRLPPHLWRIDDKAQTIDVITEISPTIDGLAKGYVLDRAAEAGRATGVKNFLLMIGGDTVVSGDMPEMLTIADPLHPADNAPPLAKIRVKGRAVATSGGYARGVDVQKKHYSHIIDPRTGRPAESVLQATVLAPNAVDADAVATILNVLSPNDGLALAATLNRVECLIVDKDGKTHQSPGWAKAAIPLDATGPTAGAWPNDGRVDVRFEIPKQDGGGRGGYRRPYVAVWIEDLDDRPVRTLTLWVEKDRWIADLRRWGRRYDGRYDDVGAVTRATRAPGRYDLSWDGRDDAGRPLPAGSYTLYIEAVREHGGYEMLKEDIVIDGKPFDKEFKGEGKELGAAKVSFTTGSKK